MANGKFQNFMNRMFDPGPNVTEQSIAQNRALADALMAGGPPQIQHPLQGLAHLANAMNAQAYRQKAQRGQQALEKQRAQQMGDLLNNLSLDPQGRQLIQSLGPDMQREVASTLAVSQLMPEEQDVNTKTFREGDEFVTRKVVNGLPDMTEAGVLSRSPIDRVQRVEQGGPGAFSPSEASGLRDAEVAATNYVQTVGDALNLLQQNPDINTWAGRGAALVNDLQQEGKAFARAFGMDFNENVLDPSAHKETFDALGIQNNRMRSLITSLAFQAAAASGQEGRSVSDRDVQRFIQEIGASSADPRAFARVLSDTAQRTVRGFQNNYRIRLQKEFEGDLGLGGLPGVEGDSALPPDIEALLKKYE